MDQNTQDPSMQDIKSHQRINDILLGPLERPALQFFARNMPAWVTPDKLTTLGVLGSVLIFASYILTSRDPAFLWLASLGFVINWFGDSLDGTLARYRNIQRPIYGFYVDHSLDAASESLIFIGLGLSPYVRLDLALLALVGYLLMSILVYIRTCVDGVFKISYGKLGPTEVRLIAIIANTVLFFSSNPQWITSVGTFGVYDLIVSVIIVLLFSFFITTTFQDIRRLQHVDGK
ncbi:MAG TPA: CDP-alcohol phosphatidyltransferase family protein [Anaerolineales bacterium]|nr:CDP-alcohol phosphatidyltransferase family protein [Anaerolineales bacterium]